MQLDGVSSIAVKSSTYSDRQLGCFKGGTASYPVYFGFDIISILGFYLYRVHKYQKHLSKIRFFFKIFNSALELTIKRLNDNLFERYP